MHKQIKPADSFHRENSKSEAPNPKQILNLHPVESSEGGAPKGGIPQGGCFNDPNNFIKIRYFLNLGHNNLEIVSYFVIRISYLFYKAIAS